jgi:hypothetical protein
LALSSAVFEGLDAGSRAGAVEMELWRTLRAELSNSVKTMVLGIGSESGPVLRFDIIILVVLGHPFAYRVGDFDKI